MAGRGRDFAEMGSHDLSEGQRKKKADEKVSHIRRMEMSERQRHQAASIEEQHRVLTWTGKVTPVRNSETEIAGRVTI